MANFYLHSISLFSLILIAACGLSCVSTCVKLLILIDGMSFNPLPVSVLNLLFFLVVVAILGSSVEMMSHPILATEDDKEYVHSSIQNMSANFEAFFNTVERIYIDNKSEEVFRAFTIYHGIQATLKVLCRVPSSSFRRNDSTRRVDKEVLKRINRLCQLFLDETIVVGPQAIQWRDTAVQLAKEAAEQLKEVCIEFPKSSVIIRKAVTYHSVLSTLIVVMFIASVILVVVALVTMPVLSPSFLVGISFGTTVVLFLCFSSVCITYLFILSTRSLQVLYDSTVEERIRSKGNPSAHHSLTNGSQEANDRDSSSVPSTRRAARGGYYAIPNGNTLGYIEGRHVDARIVMIGFDEKFRVTRWNMAAEVVTGFLENGCLGKLLSELVITPTGDLQHDLDSLQTTHGSTLKVKLRAFATMPVTLFIVSVPLLNEDGNAVGRVLIGANERDSLGEYRTYFRDYIVSEANLSLSKLMDSEILTTDGCFELRSLQSFMTYAHERHVDELARGMSTDWEWTSSEQLLGRVLRQSEHRHETNVDLLFPTTLCLHPCVPRAIGCVLNALDTQCTLGLQVINSTGSIFSLVVLIDSGLKIIGDETSENIREAPKEHMRSACGSITRRERTVILRFPCQVTSVLEDNEISSHATEGLLNEQSIIDQTRAIVNCTVNVLTLITNLVDQQNISMTLLKTMFVSLTSVLERHELEKRLKASPNDVDVIICDRGWLNSVRDLFLSMCSDIIVVPIAEQGASYASEGFQYVINTPISPSDVRKLLMDIGTVVSLKKNAATAQEMRDRILTLRQDSPWTKGKLLGRGSFGAVYEATSDLTGGKMAVKMFYFNEDREESISELLNEIQIMCSLNHPNIVHYFHCERKDNSVNLFMELCSCSLSDVILGRRPRPPGLTVVHVLRQLLTALTYLHARGVAHRDVKPQNILIKGNTVKITDFGTARQGVGSAEVQGTLRYMAPEVYRGDAHSSPCDIWSVGCVAAELFLCPPSFMANPLILGDVGFMQTCLKNLTGNPVLSNFLQKCLQLEPERRGTAADLLLHPLFAQSSSAAVESLPNVFNKQKAVMNLTP
ncbi:putative protein kinase [Trypanosoma vivax]|nr:putative protein kinase [Trypanosoma vivax]